MGARKPHLTPVGKPAPPRPRMPLALTCSITSFGSISDDDAASGFIAAVGFVGVDAVAVLFVDAGHEKARFHAAMAVRASGLAGVLRVGLRRPAFRACRRPCRCAGGLASAGCRPPSAALRSSGSCRCFCSVTIAIGAVPQEPRHSM